MVPTKTPRRRDFYSALLLPCFTLEVGNSRIVTSQNIANYATTFVVAHSLRRYQGTSAFSGGRGDNSSQERSNFITGYFSLVRFHAFTVVFHLFFGDGGGKHTNLPK